MIYFPRPWLRADVVRSNDRGARALDSIGVTFPDFMVIGSNPTRTVLLTDVCLHDLVWLLTTSGLSSTVLLVSPLLQGCLIIIVPVRFQC